MAEVTEVFGIEVEDIVADGHIPTEVIVILKVIDDEGDARVGYIFSDGLATWESLGLARSLVLHLERQINDATRSRGDA